MGICEFCNLSDTDRKFLLYENTFWSVYLADKQDYVGRCIVVSERHCESLSELTSNEWLLLKDIISSVENMLKSELGATMFNWSCLMNDSYKSNPPNPHVHFHVRPRYAVPVCIGDSSFVDADFAHHYNNKSEDKLNENSKKQLFLQLKLCMVSLGVIFQMSVYSVLLASKDVSIMETLISMAVQIAAVIAYIFITVHKINAGKYIGKKPIKSWETNFAVIGSAACGYVFVRILLGNITQTIAITAITVITTVLSVLLFTVAAFHLIKVYYCRRFKIISDENGEETSPLLTVKSARQ